MIRVYIASPYTIGDKEENVKNSLKVGNDLINMGFAPFCPLLTHYQDMNFPQSYETWLNLDFEWLMQCNCVLRLPGQSSGADREAEGDGRCREGAVRNLRGRQAEGYPSWRLLQAPLQDTPGE